MITVIGCETTGIPLWKKPITDGAQPRIVHLAAVQFDRDGTVINRFAFLMKRDGWVSSGDAAAIHRIPERRCDMYGMRHYFVMGNLLDMVRNSRAVAAFDLRFRRFMVEIELVRAVAGTGAAAGLPTGWIGKRQIPIREICIMEEAAQVVSGGKRVSISAAHEAVLGVPYEHRNNAEEGADAAARILWRLVAEKKVEI